MKTEKTLSIIKPDATNRNITGKINSKFEESGLKIIAQKRIEFYGIHKDKPFFKNLVQYMTSGPVIVQVLMGENAVLKNREIMGATNPNEAVQGTIRNEFGLNIEANSVHGSDSIVNAKKEINFFFSECEMIYD